ncbi:MAG TPA: hypothetical protein VLC46_15635 [Thermoanaerobaculia bacterium]|nr:hypothetical protein [Thermoanaerobaculia bacterium]
MRKLQHSTCSVIPPHIWRHMAEPIRPAKRPVGAFAGAANRWKTRRRRSSRS